jgi:phospholipase C
VVTVRLLAPLISLAALVVACTAPEAAPGGASPTLGPQVRCARVVATAEHGISPVGANPRADGTLGLTEATRRIADYRFRVRDELREPVTQLYAALVDLMGAAGTDDDRTLNSAVSRAANLTGSLERLCRRHSGAGVDVPPGAHKIKHVVIVMQENRSFDHYFGTFPGADGIPMRRGVPRNCVPNPAIHGCSRSWHSFGDYDHGGPHTYDDSVKDINAGRMDGFIRQWQKTRAYCLAGHSNGRRCTDESAHPDVMAYHDGGDIPNYWTYARRFVLQDHMFEPNLGWSQPAHLALVSGWAAVCKTPYLAITCRPSVTFTDVDGAWPHAPSFGWTDVTHLLHAHGVSWRYYVAPGSVNDCEGTTDQQLRCTPGSGAVGTVEPWNPLPDFTDVRHNHQVGNVQKHPALFKAAREGTLASVSWVMPGWNNSEHPPARVSPGQAWVTRVVNALMASPEWDSMAIFIAWDDWGGFYDHVVPPRVDEYSYGLRVPGLMISPYARAGLVDHQVLSFDAYLELIEDLFLDGARLDPYTDGRWDPRPRVAEEARQLGDLMSEFNFRQRPIRPFALPEYPS